jgi:hypothetical protein
MGTFIRDILFYELENQEHLASRTEFRGTSGQSSWKPTNPERSTEKWKNGMSTWRAHFVHQTASPHCRHGRRSPRSVYLPRRPSSVLPQLPQSRLPSLFTDLLVMSSSGKMELAGWANGEWNKQRVGDWYIFYGTRCQWKIPGPKYIGL